MEVQSSLTNKDNNSGNISAATPNGDAGSTNTKTADIPQAGTDPEKASGNNAENSTTNTSTPSGGFPVKIVSTGAKEQKVEAVTPSNEAVANVNDYRAKVLAFLDVLTNGTTAEKRQSAKAIQYLESAAKSLDEAVESAGGDVTADIATYPIGFDSRATYKEKRAAVIGNITHTAALLSDLTTKKYEDSVQEKHVSSIKSAVDSLNAANSALAKLR